MHSAHPGQAHQGPRPPHHRHGLRGPPRVLAPWLKRGVRFVRKRVTRRNMAALLGKYLGPGDLLIDLAWNIDCCEILQWCHDRGVLYVNTSVELWDPYENAAERPAAEDDPLLAAHEDPPHDLQVVQARPHRRPRARRQPRPHLPLHQAGPARHRQTRPQGPQVKGKAADEIRQLAAEQQFNRLAMKLGVKVIHCSERDTQITDQPKQVDEFVNTWSVEGFREEGTTTAEMGWGTHEKELPALAYTHKDGPRNQICLARMGMNTWVCSWVPDYCIHGMVVRHGEAFTISDHLTVWKNGKAVYRPTVHYAYCPATSPSPPSTSCAATTTGSSRTSAS